MTTRYCTRYAQQAGNVINLLKATSNAAVDSTADFLFPALPLRSQKFTCESRQMLVSMGEEP